MKGHRLLRWVLLLCLIGSHAFAQHAWMPDPHLREAVRQKLGIPNENLLIPADMQRLYDLVVPRSNIADITGLEHAIYLEFLHLSDSLVSDLTPLAGLKWLKVLKIHRNQISNISPLTNLTNLEFLNIEGNQITDISPLAKLVNLQTLKLGENPITDFSVIEGLQRLNFGFCDLRSERNFQERINGREYPSVFAAWHNIINLPNLSWEDSISYHDLYFCCPEFGLHFSETEQGIKLVGDVERARHQRNVLLEKNPNMILLVAIPYFGGVGFDEYPEDWPLWLRDEAGNRVRNVGWSAGLLDFTLPETQEWAIAHAAAVAKCGLFDGIFLDHWNEDPRLRGYHPLEAEHQARDAILQGIRKEVGDDFLIMVNANRRQIPRWAPYVNGIFMETGADLAGKHRYEGLGYTHSGLFEIENTLSWAELHLREPRINGLEGWGVIEELPDSPENQRWMRVFTTMSLTHSDGYVLYTIGSASLVHEHPWNNAFLSGTYGHMNSVPHVHDHEHYWYDFWDADLGKPVGEKAQLYRNREGLFIREFTNGWAVYNRSGRAHHIQFPEKVSGVASGREDKFWHELPDLDGEIYLKARLETAPADVNGDGIVNILDVVAVANAFGEAAPDLNGDGTVNILDLVIVANAFGSP